MAKTKKLIEYKKLITEFLNCGYKLCPFDDSPPSKKALLLRHDVDFDVLLAKEMALLEKDMKVKSTYFFMLRSNSYNLLSKENIEAVWEIIELGHNISLHFDPVIYEDFKKGLAFELNLFQNIFKFKPKCISIHRPQTFFVEGKSLSIVKHTYQASYFRKISYFSDSQGEFKYGNPICSKAFKEKKSIHLLIHPIWWVTDVFTPINILDGFLKKRIRRFQIHIASNCKPYKNVVGDIDE